MNPHMNPSNISLAHSQPAPPAVMAGPEAAAPPQITNTQVVFAGINFVLGCALWYGAYKYYSGLYKARKG
jgi:hypothetical protein